ncbi:hypothetical protein MICRO8M_90024 [Microbacterium sp. 8M]|uniref:hypothetical protein n=1 Tax=Microbacterium sp. 8M TaxID=2653153 RepID=UPI0012EFFC72|nr:hypothetical protein [Microbacterium sp. 8M]VXC30002.1 hypothetical protein MICRO8M_90024 [Microbacterium sp. 8M]
MGTSQREANAAADHFLLKVARENPLQTLSDKELRLDVAPLTTYPKPIRAKTWVRFAAIPVGVDYWIHRHHRGRRRDLLPDPRQDVPPLVWRNAVSIP